MNRWLAAVLLLLASLVSFPLHAQGYVSCVQAQLGQGGDASALGPATLQAAANLDPDDLPPLTERTAYDWCRALGESDPDLRALWPGLSADTTWVPPDRVGAGLETVARQALADARAYVRGQYGLEIVGSYTFLTGTESDELEAAAKAHRQAQGRRASGLFRTSPMPCGTDHAPRAIAFRDMALFCGADVRHDSDWVAANQTWWTRTFVHEYVHGLQNELAGTLHRGRLPSGERALGPKWLVEGAAEVIEEEFYATQTRFKERSIGRHKRKTALIDTSLGDLHDHVRSTADYDVSQFAADLLGARYGRAALFDYFEALRGANSWAQAFDETFDMPLETFEAEFETLRRDLVAAYTFANRAE